VAETTDNPEAIVGRGLFPLPLSDFEFYMLTDDRPSHPMVFVMVVDVVGELTQSPFAQSLRELIAAHPLLGCRVEKLPGKGWCWVPFENVPDVLDWSAAEEAATEFVPAVERIDLLNQPGIRVRVVASATRARIVLHLHHSCSDGIGALHLVGELFARYGQKTAESGGKRPQFEPTEISKLLQRENYDVGEAATQRQKKSLMRVLGKISRLLFRFPIKLASSAEMKCSGSESQRSLAPASTQNTHAIQSRILPRSVNRALRAAATERDVSINDLFISEMMLLIRDWNRRSGKRDGEGWIRLAIPLSMRTGLHERMPATNIVSYALVTRRAEMCDHPDQLLASIHQQTSDVLYNREGIVCLKLFRVLRKIPGAMKLFLGAKSVFCTMVLANVGDVRRRFSGRFPLDKGRWVAGNVVIEQIHGVAPVRPNTRAAMSIGEYAGDLSISLRADGLVLNASDSEQFLNEFLERLQTLAEHSHLPDNEELVTE
jgi:NRPS condensation-like uncharacterized protein